MVVDLCDLELKTIHDPEAFRNHAGERAGLATSAPGGAATVMQARLSERALAIAGSYRQALIQAGGLARECPRCLMASPPSETPCPFCGEAGPFALLEVAEYLASTILHRLRCTTRPDRSLERVPQLLNQVSQADTNEAAPEPSSGG